jgi:hypothetical protein
MSDKGRGVPDFSAKGWMVTLFLSWEKEIFEEISVKQSILKKIHDFSCFKPFFLPNLGRFCSYYGSK